MHPWNEPIFESLKRARERLPHALLVHGPRGVGKLALAERLAQLLLCEHADPAARPCGTCDGCRWHLGGNHPDFRRLEPEAIAKSPPEAEAEEEGSEAPARRSKQPSLFITVDQIRALASFLNLRSHRGALRVALLHPAEDLYLPNGANALLESLERLAEALQKIAYDRAFSAFGLAPKYQTGAAPATAAKARAWLAYAREMGENRVLTRHPLNPRLFSADLLGKIVDLT